MPAYEIEYITPLKESQKDQLAEAVTSIHSNVFTIPSLLVNVRFTDVTKHDTYVGGKKVSIRAESSAIHYFVPENSISYIALIQSYLRLCQSGRRSHNGRLQHSLPANDQSMG